MDQQRNTAGDDSYGLLRPFSAIKWIQQVLAVRLHRFFISVVQSLVVIAGIVITTDLESPVTSVPNASPSTDTSWAILEVRSVET